MHELPELLRNDHNFRRFLISRMLMSVGWMASGFVTVAAVEHWHVPDSTVGLYTASLMVGQMAGNIIFGFLADRLGHKLCMELGILASFLGFTLALVAPVAQLFFLVFVLLGIGSAAVMVSGILIVLEFCEPERRPTYIGITNTGVGLDRHRGAALGRRPRGNGIRLAVRCQRAGFAAGLDAHALVGKDPRWA